MIKGTPRAISDRVLVTDMHFGEQKTASGLIIGSDDGKTRGIYPRWSKVYSKGPNNNDEYEVGQWILVEHGRWTRAQEIETPDGIIKFWMVDPTGIIGYSDEKPNDLMLGQEHSDGPVDINPEMFTDSRGMF